MSEKPDRDQQTEAPTPKRRRDAEKKGDVLQSRELATALVMAAGLGWLALAGPMLLDAVQDLLRAGLRIERADLADFEPGRRTFELLAPGALPIAALFGATLVAAVAAPALLGSLGFRAQCFAPKASKQNPATGLMRMFGMQGLTELGKSLLKLALLGTIGWAVLSGNIADMLGLAALAPGQAARSMGQQFLALVGFLVPGFIVVGLVDAPVQIFQRNARLRMSKQEVKEEHKESEGSPETKAMARQRRHDLLNGSARRAVTEATVVLTNPTHFAVALRYRPGTDAVPMVVARGRGETALAIRELAREAEVAQLEYPQLARAIYFTTRAGQPIAKDLYLAVATVLAFVFNIERAMAEGAARPEVAVPPTLWFDENGRKQG